MGANLDAFECGTNALNGGTEFRSTRNSGLVRLHPISYTNHFEKRRGKKNARVLPSGEISVIPVRCFATEWAKIVDVCNKIDFIKKWNFIISCCVVCSILWCVHYHPPPSNTYAFRIIPSHRNHSRIALIHRADLIFSRISWQIRWSCDAIGF